MKIIGHSNTEITENYKNKIPSNITTFLTFYSGFYSPPACLSKHSISPVILPLLQILSKIRIIIKRFTCKFRVFTRRRVNFPKPDFEIPKSAQVLTHFHTTTHAFAYVFDIKCFMGKLKKLSCM